MSNILPIAREGLGLAERVMSAGLPFCRDPLFWGTWAMVYALLLCSAGI